jgi:hypothetical protein
MNSQKKAYLGRIMQELRKSASGYSSDALAAVDEGGPDVVHKWESAKIAVDLIGCVEDHVAGLLGEEVFLTPDSNLVVA